MSWWKKVFGGKSLSLDEITAKRHELTKDRDEFFDLLQRINVSGVASAEGKAWAARRDELDKKIKAIEKELTDSNADTSSIPRAPTSVVIEQRVLEVPAEVAVASVAAVAAPDAPAASSNRRKKPPKSAAQLAEEARLRDLGLLAEEKEAVPEVVNAAIENEPEEPLPVLRRLRRPRVVLDDDPEPSAQTTEDKEGSDKEDNEEQEDEEEEDAEEAGGQSLFAADGAAEPEEPTLEVVVDPLEEEKAKDTIFNGVRVGKVAAPAKVAPNRFSVVLAPKKPYEYPELTQRVIQAAQKTVKETMGHPKKSWWPSSTKAYEIALGVRLKGEAWKHLSFLHTGAGTWKQSTDVPGKQNAWREFCRSVCPLLRTQKHVVDTDQVEIIVFSDWYDYHVNRFSMGLPDVVDTQQQPDDYYDVITAWDKRAARHAGEEYYGITEEQRTTVESVMQRCMELVNTRMQKDEKNQPIDSVRAGCRSIPALYLLLAYAFAFPSGLTPDAFIGRAKCDLFWELVHPETKPVRITDTESMPAHEVFYLLCDESYSTNEDADAEEAEAEAQKLARAFTRIATQVKGAPAETKRAEDPKKRRAGKQEEQMEDEDDAFLSPEELAMRKKKKNKGTQGKRKPEEESGAGKRSRADTTAAIRSGRVPLDPSRRLNWYDHVHPVTSHIPLSEAEQRKLDDEYAVVDDDEDAVKFGASWMENYPPEELGLTDELYKALPRRQAVFKLIPAARHAVYNADPEVLRQFLENCKVLAYKHHFFDDRKRKGIFALAPRASANITRDTTYTDADQAWISVSVPLKRRWPIEGERVAAPKASDNPDVHRKQWNEYQYDSAIRTMEFQEMLRIMGASKDVFPQFWNYARDRFKDEPDYKSGDMGKRQSAVRVAASLSFLAPFEDRLGGFWALGREHTLAAAGTDLMQRVSELDKSGGVVTKEMLIKLGENIEYPYEPSKVDGKGYADKLRSIIAERAVVSNAKFAVNDPEDCARLRPSRVMRPEDEAEFVATIRASFAQYIKRDYDPKWVAPTVEAKTLFNAQSAAAQIIRRSVETADVSKFADYTEEDNVDEPATGYEDADESGEDGAEEEEEHEEEEEGEEVMDVEEPTPEDAAPAAPPKTAPVVSKAPTVTATPKATPKAAPAAAVSVPFRKPPEVESDEEPMEVEPPPKRETAAPGPDMGVRAGMSMPEARARMKQWVHVNGVKDDPFPSSIFDPATVRRALFTSGFTGNLRAYAEQLAKN